VKNDRFKAKLAALDALRDNAGDAVAVPLLRKALADRSNVLVAKAADVIGDLRTEALLADMLAAFDRLLNDTAADAGCRGKTALAKALKELEHRDPAVFLRGLAHVQKEPVWGGMVDTAGPLRAVCAHALVACDLAPQTLLEHLTDCLVDADKTVRIDTAIAIANTGRPEGVLVLRLKALAGDSEPEVVGQCLCSLLDIEPQAALPFVARFLDAADGDIRFEAASALAAAKSTDALGYIERFWQGELPEELRRATVAALAASPNPASGTFLMGVLAEYPERLGADALAAAAASRFASALRERAESLVGTTASPALQRALAQHFPA
jgi:HEAT repeat protein